MTRLAKRCKAFSAVFAWMVASEPECPVFKESSSVRASTPRTSPRMMRSGRHRRADFKRSSKVTADLNVSVWHSTARMFGFWIGKLGGVLDDNDALMLRYRIRQDAQERGLSGARSTADE